MLARCEMGGFLHSSKDHALVAAVHLELYAISACRNTTHARCARSCKRIEDRVTGAGGFFDEVSHELLGFLQQVLLGVGFDLREVD